MAYDLGPKIGIEGEAEFRKQIQQITTGLKTMGSEMKVVTTQFIGQEDSEKALTAQNEVLGKTVTQLTSKLDAQKKMLEASTAAYGENDERTQKWQRAVNETQAELNRANAQIKENNKSLKEHGKTAEDTGGKLEGMAEKAATAAKAMGAALAAAGMAIGAIAKQSIEGYANYEQLVGGVETLFGAGGKSLEEYAAEQGKTVDEVADTYKSLQTAQEQVLSHANDAYKTAGLSANEYIETVTSVSAALINSLGGDTVKAAEVADMAITDMADNANKMGSSMESIQNAYNGFAKQNYTMLDNLKLGYGGTKSEMERLLKDAEKISGKKLDLSSYADVVEAIHVIQTEMGITGTTAKEASVTIQGSVSAMQSAWANLITGMADENANLDQLINNLVDSVVTVAGNIIPRLEFVLSGVGEVIQRLAPVIAANLPPMVEAVLPSLLEAATSLIQGLASGLVNALPALVPVAAQAIGTLVTSLVELLPELMAAAVEIVTALSADLSNQLPELIPVAVDMILALATGLIDNIDQLIDPAIEIILALGEGLINALPKLLEKAPVIIGKLVTALVENLPKILEMGARLIGELVLGIIGALPEVGYAAGQIISSIVDGILGLIANIWDVGTRIVSGLWEGIKSKASWLKDQVTGFFSGIVNGVKDFLGIHSPSRVFAGIGENMAAGLGEGWDKEYKDVQKNILSGLSFDAGKVSANLAMPGMTAPTNTVTDDLRDMMAGVVNGVQTAVAGSENSMPHSATIVLQTVDGMTVARWLLPDLRAAMRDDPADAI